MWIADVSALIVLLPALILLLPALDRTALTVLLLLSALQATVAAAEKAKVGAEARVEAMLSQMKVIWSGGVSVDPGG